MKLAQELVLFTLGRQALVTHVKNTRKELKNIKIFGIITHIIFTTLTGKIWIEMTTEVLYYQ